MPCVSKTTDAQTLKQSTAGHLLRLGNNTEQPATVGQNGQRHINGSHISSQPTNTTFSIVPITETANDNTLCAQPLALSGRSKSRCRPKRNDQSQTGGEKQQDKSRHNGLGQNILPSIKQPWSNSKSKTTNRGQPEILRYLDAK